mmetsp:Transcript_7543/g.10226  ORF Transcript_7543/g.10226 Transcript_7543/m.10226 type:complete len:131 (-) Transcript_7543:166-558(-)|eukprot:CAMPEP_0185723496 /NCGR_PEP_ID=MMETSP1171-20130828/327_1 /TAXON_ID=374046 /ORGANISM="Helicotheca tamensis, Strain CCMP826" /LENGTH=130 /DNA_ID=CAMNT_0028391209 /DNA_START=119 /DNA_END=511 /DNA_ORIENTATION=+
MPPRILTPKNTTTAASRYFKQSTPNTNKSEALSLYRDILRTTKAFHWCDEKGEPWNKRLRLEARKEFEASKEEKDPLILARLLVTGRQAVMEIQRRFEEADRKCWERIERDSNTRDFGGDGHDDTTGRRQ